VFEQLEGIGFLKEISFVPTPTCKNCNNICFNISKKGRDYCDICNNMKEPTELCSICYVRKTGKLMKNYDENMRV